jgi:hypothetical protein
MFEKVIDMAKKLNGMSQENQQAMVKMTHGRAKPSVLENKHEINEEFRRDQYIWLTAMDFVNLMKHLPPSPH